MQIYVKAGAGASRWLSVLSTQYPVPGSRIFGSLGERSHKQIGVAAALVLGNR